MKKIKQLIRKIFFIFYYNLFHKRKLKKTVVEKINGYSFIVYPTVFNPKDYFSSVILANFIKSMSGFEGKYVLDMGCGSGIVSVFAASKGAKCLAVDINPVSVKCTIENIKRNNVQSLAEVVQSDLFENIESSKKFDVMIFGPPYYEGEPANYFEGAFKGGKDYRVIRDFIKQSSSYLAKGGEIYFIISTDMNIKTLEDMFVQNGYKFQVVKTEPRFFETFYITKAFF